MANVNNYINAAAAGMRGASSIFASLQDNKFKADEIAKVNIIESARTDANKAINEAKAARARISADEAIRIAKNDTKTSDKISGYKRQARMTGKLAGGAALIGVGAMQLNKKEEPDPTLELLQTQISKYDDKIASSKEELDRLTSLVQSLNPANKKDNNSATSNTGATTTKTEPSTNPTSSTNSTLTGAAKTVADAIAKYESGKWGYEAFNQGGTAGGTKVLGKSGSYKDIYGTSLADLTLQQIFDKQNTKAKGMSFQEHLDSGGLHAVGRYQFIGSTLQDEVRRMGLDPSTTKFTPEIQDAIFKSHAKRIGNISPWVGPMQYYSQAERDRFNSLIQQF